MYKKKHIRSLLLASLMFITSGCSPKAATPETTNQTNSNNQINETQKPKQITAMLDIFSISEEDGRQQILNKYKELTGIELYINQPPHNQYYEKVNLSFASGDLPDVIELAPSDNTSFLTYATQGALTDITNWVENSTALKNANQTIVNSMRVDGKLFGFPSDTGNGSVTMLRQDWLDNLGLNVPTNYEEFLNVLRAFTFNDPDKNGKNDTKGFTAAGFDNITDNYRYILDFMQDAVPNFIQKDGVWVDGFQEPEMIAAIERIKAAYKEGIIDQDIITNKTSTAREKFQTGEIGCMSYWAGQWNVSLENKAKRVNSSAEIVSIPPIAEVTYINRVPPAHCITSACDNPEAAFKYFIEFMHDGGEGQTLFTYGVEGLTYDIADGKGEWRGTLSDPSTPYSKVVLNPFLEIVPFKENIFEPPALLSDSLNKFNTRTTQAALPLLTDTYIKMNADIIEARSTAFSKMILGDMSIEEGMSSYTKKVNNELRMQTILQEMNSK